MKARISFYIVLLAMIVFSLGFLACVCNAATVKVVQVEYAANKSYAPDNSKVSVQIQDFTAQVSKNVFTGGLSAHATQVAQLLTAGPAKGLIASPLQLFEEGSFMADLQVGKTFVPNKAAWELENHSWGGYDAINGPTTLAKEAERLVRDNVLAFIAVPDAGDTNLPLLNTIQSPYVVKVGSTTTGMSLTYQCQPDVYEPDNYTSYACPHAAQVGVEEIAWCKDRAIVYRACDLARILIFSAVPDSQGRRVVNETAAMNNLAAFYHVAISVPTPTPTPSISPIISVNGPASAVIGQSAVFSVTAEGTQPFLYSWQKNNALISGANAATFIIAQVTQADSGSYSVIVSNPAGSTTSTSVSLTVSAPVVTPTPKPAPSPAPVATKLPNAIFQFNHWNAYFASAATPATLYWQIGANVAKAELIDPVGTVLDVTASPTFNYGGATLHSVILSSPASSMAQVTWTLRLTMTDGSIQTQTHGLDAILPGGAK